MERTLAIPELLSMILRQTNRRTHASANLVCKSWREVAIAVLWGDTAIQLHTAIHQALCGGLPPVPQTEAAVFPEGFVLAYQPLLPATEISSAQWHAFANFAKWIKDLLIHEPHPFPDPTVMPQLLDLARQHGTLPLFPRLQSLTINFGFCPDHTTILLSPLLYPHSLHTFDVQFFSTTDRETLQQCIKLLEAECPYLQTLRLRVRSEIDITETYASGVPRFRRLKEFSANMGSMPMNLLTYVAKGQPGLDVLALKSTASDPLPIPDLHHQMLSLGTFAIGLSRGLHGEELPPLTRALDLLTSFMPRNLWSLMIDQKGGGAAAGAETATSLHVLIAGLPEVVPRLRELRLTLGGQVTVGYEELQPLTRLSNMEVLWIEHDNSPGGFIDLRINEEQLFELTAALPNLVEFSVQTTSNNDPDDDDEAETTDPQPPLLTPAAIVAFAKHCPKLTNLKIRLDFGICMVTGWDTVDSPRLLHLHSLDLTDSWFFWDEDPLVTGQSFNSQTSLFAERVTAVSKWLRRVCTSRTKVHADAEQNRYKDHAAWSQVRGACLMERSGDASRTYVERCLTSYAWCMRYGKQVDPAVQKICDHIFRMMDTRKNNREAAH